MKNLAPRKEPDADRLKFYRIMSGEYRSDRLDDGHMYYIDKSVDYCTGCDHHHDYWKVSAGRYLTDIEEVGRGKTLTEAKAVANQHAVYIGAIQR